MEDVRCEMVEARLTSHAWCAVLILNFHPGQGGADDPGVVHQLGRDHLQVAVDAGASTDDTGRVEFIAEYVSDTGPGRHHECSVFKKRKGEWFYMGEEDESA